MSPGKKNRGIPPDFMKPTKVIHPPIHYVSQFKKKKNYEQNLYLLIWMDSSPGNTPGFLLYVAITCLKIILLAKKEYAESSQGGTNNVNGLWKIESIQLKLNTFSFLGVDHLCKICKVLSALDNCVYL